LYRKTMNCGWKDIFGASLASLGLSHAIARGIITGIIQDKGVFKVTAKGVAKSKKLAILNPVIEETILLCALIICAVAMIATRGIQNFDAQLWVTLLALQSLPYVSALACQILAHVTDKDRPSTLTKPVLHTST
jgi:hypothetical protein